MTQPPFPPNPGEPGDPGATQPSPPAASEPFAPVTPSVYAPVGAASVYTPPAPVARRAGGSARALNLSLAAAVLIAGCGASFAVGRASVPAAAATPQGPSGAVRDPNVGSGGPQNGNAGPLASGGGLPNASLGANGGFDRGDDNGGGFGRGLGSPTIEGTVTGVSGGSVTVRLANGATVAVGLDGSTTYHQQTSGSQGDVAAGKTVVLRVNGRFGPDELQGGGTLGTATDVTVLP